MNKENCTLKLVDETILYYDARSKKHIKNMFVCSWPPSDVHFVETNRNDV